MDHLILGILVLASVVGLTFIIERGFALRAKRVMPPEIKMVLAATPGESELTVLRKVCVDHPSPLGRLILFAEAHRHWPKAENVTSLETHARYEISKLERGLVVLEIVVGIAPLLGLVGTIYGLILLFATMGETGPGSSSDLAHGIATALYATLLGLLTAIPSLVAWCYFNKKVETFAVELATLCEDFLRSQYHAKDAIAPSAQASAESPR